MEANPKDLAEFARLGLRFGILTTPAVVAWADGIIAESDDPPPWTIDLALATWDTVEAALNQVPGEAQADLPTRLFLALVRLRWRSGSLTIGEVRGIGWRLHVERASPESDEHSDWGACLESEGEELDQGWRTEDDLRRSIEEKLDQYADLAPMLPAWA